MRMYRSRWLWIALGLAALAVAGTAYATIPGANGTISACRDSQGRLKVIDAQAGQSCSSSQQPLTWNQQGPPGAQGAPGVSNYHVVRAASDKSSDEMHVTTALCPAGEKVIGGGGEALQDYGSSEAPSSNVAITVSEASGVSGWVVWAAEVNSTAANWYVVARAICATVQ